MNGEEVYLSMDTHGAILLTTLPAPPTDILIRKTRTKRKKMVDGVGGSSQQLFHVFSIAVLVG